MPESVAELIGTFGVLCDHCHMPIMAARTVTGDPLPVDAETSQFGTVRVYRDSHKLIAQVIGTLTERRRLTLGGWPLFRPHRLSCPKASEWSRGHRKPTTPNVSMAAGGLW